MSLSCYSQENSSKDNQDKKGVSIDSLHSPKKATLLSVLLPGSGQIYNNKYRPQGKNSKLWWKLPIIYGGIGASVYSAIQYQNFYKEIFNERKARLNPDYIFQIYPTYTNEQLHAVQENYRQFRDYSIIAGLAIYVLNIIDANVEGHLVHFDVSNQLSLNILPSYSLSRNTSHFGAKITLKIK